MTIVSRGKHRQENKSVWSSWCSPMLPQLMTGVDLTPQVMARVMHRPHQKPRPVMTLVWVASWSLLCLACVLGLADATDGKWKLTLSIVGGVLLT